MDAEKCSDFYYEFCYEFCHLLRFFCTPLLANDKVCVTMTVSFSPEKQGFFVENTNNSSVKTKITESG